MRLAALQRTMARAVMQPLTSDERMQNRAPDGKSMRAYASRFIKPNDRLTSFDRLEIYNRQYWFRLLSSMIEDFPGLRAVLGDKRFEAMSKAYFKLLERQPKMRDVLALGNHLVWVTPSGTALVIDANHGKDKLSDAAIDKLFVARK